MQGGTTRNGRSYTLAVVGLYSISWIRSFWNTTAPSVVATLRPTSNWLSSVIETWPCWMSCSRFCRPRAMLSPRVSIAFCWASALSTRKLLGAEAAIHCSTAKRSRALVLASVSTASTRPSMRAAVEQVGGCAEGGNRVAAPGLGAEALVARGRAGKAVVPEFSRFLQVGRLQRGQLVRRKAELRQRLGLGESGAQPGERLQPLAAGEGFHGLLPALAQVLMEPLGERRPSLSENACLSPVFLSDSPGFTRSIPFFMLHCNICLRMSACTSSS